MEIFSLCVEGEKRPPNQTGNSTTQKNIFENLSNQTEIRLYLPCTDWVGTANEHCPFAVPNQSENGKYNLISVWFNKISKTFLCVYNSQEAAIEAPLKPRKHHSNIVLMGLKAHLNALFFPYYAAERREPVGLPMDFISIRAPSSSNVNTFFPPRMKLFSSSAVRDAYASHWGAKLRSPIVPLVPKWYGSPPLVSGEPSIGSSWCREAPAWFVS